MTTDRSFKELMTRVQAGDQQAAYQVFNHYVQRLVGLARGHLDRLIRRKVDPEDVLQSVWKSFFNRHAHGQFELDGWDGLWALLAQITVRKCGRWNEYYRAQRRRADREAYSLSDPDRATAVWQALISSEPTPSEATSLVETVQHLMEGLDERDRTIVSLRLQDYTVPEISNQVGRTEYTVNQVLKRVRKRLQRWREDRT
jgi:RNA polymerase sigma-70 factor (ECF subfamily)